MAKKRVLSEGRALGWQQAPGAADKDNININTPLPLLSRLAASPLPSHPILSSYQHNCKHLNACLSTGAFQGTVHSNKRNPLDKQATEKYARHPEL